MSDQLKPYTVALPIDVAASTPEEAISAFIQQVNLHGLTVWHYTVVEDGGQPTMVRLSNSEEDEETDEPVDESTSEPSD